MKNLWNALHYDATIVFARDSESQLFESQERPAVHAAAWSTLDSTQNHCRTGFYEDPTVYIIPRLRNILKISTHDKICVFAIVVGHLN